MFGEQAPRLLRETWPNPTMLAQELFAIFSSTDLPLSHNGPVTLTGDTTLSPLTINNFGDAAPITIVNEDGDTFEINVEGDTITINGDAITTVVSGGTGSGGLAGTVVSGSGASYTVNLDDGGGDVAVEQRPSSTDDIPAGTKVVVFQRDNGTYFMCQPVFL